MTRTLAVLSQALHSLVDETYVLLIDVESQQAQSPSRAATDTVQKLECLTHQVIVVLVILVPQEVLEVRIKCTLRSPEESCWFYKFAQCKTISVFVLEIRKPKLLDLM